jgi:hypothetical protein
MHVESDDDLAPRHQFARAVVALAGQGLDACEIARHLGITPVGVLELGTEAWQRSRLATYRERAATELELERLFRAAEAAL